MKKIVIGKAEIDINDQFFDVCINCVSSMNEFTQSFVEISEEGIAIECKHISLALMNNILSHILQTIIDYATSICDNPMTEGIWSDVVNELNCNELYALTIYQKQKDEGSTNITLVKALYFACSSINAIFGNSR